MQSSHFVSSLPGMWVFGLALELLLLLLAQLTPPPPESITQKKKQGNGNHQSHEALPSFFLFACPGAAPLFRTTAATAALQLQFSRICLKQIYMEGSVRAEFINAALEKLPRFFVVFCFFRLCHH